MTQNEVIRNIQYDTVCKIYFRQYKLPLIGKFVKMRDADEMYSRGFIRFVPMQRIPQFDILQAISLTRLIVISSLEYIKNEVVYEKS